MFKPKRRQQVFLAFLLALTLLGAQAVKDSPWHDHGRHVADCALCHLQAFDLDEPPAPPALPAALLARAHASLYAAAAVSAAPSPYQGRAPPALL